MNYEDCSETSSNKIITAEENRREFKINNPSKFKISKIAVDGCLIDDQRIRCDYLFEIFKIKDILTEVIYLELKGSDIDKAFRQICATLQYCKDRHNIANKKCFIVASRIPKSGTSTQEYRKKMAILHKVPLQFATSQMSIQI
ncbi:hypothetical protein DSECCO2_405460 [anaerobic digester metagenome]